MAESSLRLNVIMGMVDRITSPMQSVTSQTERMSERVKSSQQELERLGAVSRDIDSFRQLKRGAGETEAALNTAQQRVAELAREMQATEQPTKAMTREFERAKREVRDLQAQQERENQELRETRGRLDEAGVSTKNLNDATRRIREETDHYTRELAEQQQALADTSNSQQRLAEIQERNSNLRRGALVDTAKVTAGVFAITRLTNAYGDVADAQGEIASLGVSTEGIDAITRAGQEFSNQWRGTTAPDFIRASYDIKSGISSLSDTAVGEFTRIAALTGVATKSSTEQMTNLFATGFGIYRNQFEGFAADVIDGWHAMSAEERDMQFGEYFSAGIAATVQAYKTNGAEMSSAISSLGAAATSANVSFAEQLAILGTLQRTMSGSESATKYQAFLRGAGKASEDLGLRFMDANNQLRSMPEILDELRGKYGDTIDAVEEQELKKAFGTDEAVAAIKLLYDGVDELRGGIEDMDAATRGGMSTTEQMAAAMQRGPNVATQLMTQQIQNATAALGKAFAPTVIAVAGAVGSAAMAVADFSERFPMLSTGIALVAAGLLGLMTLSIVARFAFAGLSDAWIFGRKVLQFLTLSTLRHNATLAVARVRALAAGAAALVMAAAQRTMAAGMAIVTAAQWAWNAALMANPIGLVIGLIVGLIAIVALVYRYWEPLAEFFGGLWDGITEAFSAAWAAIVDFLGFDPVAWLVPLWDGLTEFFSGVWDNATYAFTVAWELIKAMLSFSPLGLLFDNWSALPDFFAGMWERVTGIFSRALDWISDKVMGPINSVRNALGSAWNAVFGSGSAEAELTQRVAHIVESTPPDLRDEPEPAQAGGGDAGPVGFLGAPVGSIAASAGGTTVIDQSDNRREIVIHQQPGQSAEDVGAEVDRRLDARERAQRRRNRSRLSD